MDHLLVIRRLSARRGEHAVEERDLSLIDLSQSGWRLTITAHHQRHHLPVRLIDDVAYRVWSKGVRGLAGRNHLFNPRHHLPRAQSGPCRKSRPALIARHSGGADQVIGISFLSTN